jgi:lipid-binding SYLF domain-containing protein
MIRRNTCWPIAGACSIALAWSCVAAAANTMTPQSPPNNKPAATSHDGMRSPRGGEARDAVDQINDAANVIQRMKTDQALASLLQKSHGVLVVPQYGRAALGVGGRGGAGVLLIRENGNWVQPSFYNYGGISIGLEAGAEGGPIAFVLNTEKALKSFEQNNNWSLNAEAGLTVATWSGKGQASAGKSDVTVWSGAKGLLGSLSVSVTDINFDGAETSAYYDQKVTSASDVISGKIQNPHSAALKEAFAQAPAPGSYERGPSTAANQNQ